MKKIKEEDKIEIPQLFVLFSMALTRDVVDYEYDGLNIGRNIFTINYIGYRKECTMGELCNYLNIQPSTATRQIDKLVDKWKVLNRNFSDKDRRNVLLTLSTKGLKIYKHHIELQQKFIHSLFVRFSPNEVNTLVNIMKEITKYDLKALVD
ncbi:MAG: hypothetical protein JW891_01035 [Candidatus Lokiarchaeota archaeon]|nr:hypothetical protein [Candidatus Lokiarchaeota archaeon]